MCVAAEDEDGGSGAAGTAGMDVPEIVVTAVRIGLDFDLSQSIDWSQVAQAGSIGALAGIGGGPGVVGLSSAAAAAAAVGAQLGVDPAQLLTPIGTGVYQQIY